MLLIIVSHYSVIGIMHTSFGEPYQIWASGQFVNRAFSSLMACGGDTGVGAFFMISGFFLCRKKTQRRISGIFCTVLFYAVFGILLHLILSLLTSGLDLNQGFIMNCIKLCLNPVTGNNWWFATAYLILIILAPVLNQLIEDISSKKMIYLIMLIWFIWYVLGYVLQINLYGIERAIWFYLIGAYICLHHSENSKKRTLLYLLTFVGSFLLYAFVTYLIASAIGENMTNGILAKKMIQDLLKCVRSTVFAPACAVSLFMLFKQWELKENASINKIAGTMFGVYLWHECPLNRELLWEGVLKVDSFQYSSVLMPVYCIGTVALIFLIGMGLDLLRQRVFERPMLNAWDRCIRFFKA